MRYLLMSCPAGIPWPNQQHSFISVVELPGCTWIGAKTDPLHAVKKYCDGEMKYCEILLSLPLNMRM